MEVPYVRISSLAALLATATLAAVAGCSSGSGVRVDFTATGFGPPQLADTRLAVVGVTLDDRTELPYYFATPVARERFDRLAQTETWSPLLYDQFLAHARSTWTYPPAFVLQTVAPDTLAEALRTYAAQRYLDPRQVDALGRQLGEVRYLAVARITNVHRGIVTHTDGAGPDQTETVKIREAVGMAMDVYDVETGRAVWSASVDKHTESLAGPDDFSRPGGAAATEQGADVLAQLEGTGVHARPSTFAGVIQKCCAALVAKLAGS
jgi:hypothetical protein